MATEAPSACGRSSRAAYLSVKGPYHPCVEELRDNKYLQDFRQWMSDQKAHANAVEIAEMKRDVEATIRETQTQVFLKYLDRRNEYTSAARSIVGVVADLIIPAISTIAEHGNKMKEHEELSATRWQDFVLTAQQTINDSRT